LNSQLQQLLKKLVNSSQDLHYVGRKYPILREAEESVYVKYQRVRSVLMTNDFRGRALSM